MLCHRREPMNDDAFAQDFEKMRSRAFHMADWTEESLRRYHILTSAGEHAADPCLHILHAWLFVPPTLWPFNVFDVFTACLTTLEQGRKLSPGLRLLTELLPGSPSEAVCTTVAEQEHHVQNGVYEYLVTTPAKFHQTEESVRSDPQLQRDWARLKKVFRVLAYRDGKGIIRRSMCVERNLRASFSVNPRRARDVFTAAFDAFCLRWNLYGMQGDEPLLLKLAVNVTPYGTMIHIPAYWSFDPKRDIRWDVIAKLHRMRVAGRQGASLAAGRAERRKLARKLMQLDRDVRRLGLTGDKKHAFLCSGLGWVAGTSPRRLQRLRAEFPAG